MTCRIVSPKNNPCSAHFCPLFRLIIRIFRRIRAKTEPAARINTGFQKGGAEMGAARHMTLTRTYRWNHWNHWVQKGVARHRALTHLIRKKCLRRLHDVEKGVARHRALTHSAVCLVDETSAEA